MISAEHVSKSYLTQNGRVAILSDVNLRVLPGEKIGILGSNGAGKSTLVRLISGAERPTGGRIVRKMSVSWPLAFTGAFQSALTGLDNFRFICRVHGVTYEDKINQIEEFAQLGRYLREPVRTYSAGMRARLAFAMSMAIEFDCFLIDEVVAVGDARFQEKSNEELFVKRADRAMIIVSHNDAYIRTHCDRAAVLAGGTLHHFATIDDAYDYYNWVLHENDGRSPSRAAIGGVPAQSKSVNVGVISDPLRSAREEFQRALWAFQEATLKFRQQAGDFSEFILDGPVLRPNAEKFAGCAILTDNDAFLAQLPHGAVGVQLGRRTPELTRALVNAAAPENLGVLDEEFGDFSDDDLVVDLIGSQIQIVEGVIYANLTKYNSESLDFLYVSHAVDYQPLIETLGIGLEKLKSGGSLACSNFTLWSPLEGKPYGVFRAIMELITKYPVRVTNLLLHPFGYFEIMLQKI